MEGKKNVEASKKLVDRHYTGGMAEEYEAGRKSNPKWIKEQKVVEDFISKNKDIATVIDAPLGTNRYGLFFEKCSHVENVYGYEYSDDMIAEAEKTISTKLKIYKHDLVNEIIKEKADLSIIMRMLNLFNEDDTTKILKNILQATEKYSILSLRHWLSPPKYIENKITIQNLHAMERVINNCGFDIIAEKEIKDSREGQYSIFTLEKS